jgi:hypothetical protein
MSIATGLPTQDGWKDQLMKLGVSFGADASFVRYGRDQELEAALIAVRLLSEARFDPHALISMFQKIHAAETVDGIRLPGFVFNHSQTESLIEELDAAIEASEDNPTRNRRSAHFTDFQSELQQIALPAEEEPADDSGKSETDALPNVYSHPMEYYLMSYPEGWQVTRRGQNSAIIAPADGIQNSFAGEDVSLGTVLDVFAIDPERALTLEQATNRLIVYLRQRNQSLRAIPGAQTHLLIDNQPGLRTVMLAESNATQSSEVIWLVTRMYYQNLFYAVFVAPEDQFPGVQPIFEQMIRSARLR